MIFFQQKVVNLLSFLYLSASLLTLENTDKNQENTEKSEAQRASSARGVINHHLSCVQLLRLLEYLWCVCVSDRILCYSHNQHTHTENRDRKKIHGCDVQGVDVVSSLAPTHPH